MYNNNIMNIVINKNSTHNFQISITITNDITSAIDTWRFTGNEQTTTSRGLECPGKYI
jgi:hypothetical protein